MRVRPALGRWFTEAEGEPGGPDCRRAVAWPLDAGDSDRIRRSSARRSRLNGRTDRNRRRDAAAICVSVPARRGVVARTAQREDGIRALRARRAWRGLRDGVSLETARSRVAGTARRHRRCLSGRSARARQRQHEVDVRRPDAERHDARRHRPRADDPAGGGRRGAAGGLRERGEPVSGSLRAAPARSRHSARARGRAPGLGRYFFTESVLLAIAGRQRSDCLSPGAPCACWCRSAPDYPAAHPRDSTGADRRSPTSPCCHWSPRSCSARFHCGAEPSTGALARKRPRQYRHAAASRRASPPARRAGGDGLDAAGRVRTDGAERAEPAAPSIRDSTPTRRSLSASACPTANIQTLEAAVLAHHAIVDRAAGAAGCDVGRRHHLPAAQHGMQWQHAARRRRRVSGRHVAAAGAVPRHYRRLLRDHGHAHPARPLDRSQRRRSPGTGRRDQPGAGEERVQGPGPDRPARGFEPAAARQPARRSCSG